MNGHVCPFLVETGFVLKSTQVLRLLLTDFPPFCKAGCCSIGICVTVCTIRLGTYSIDIRGLESALSCSCNTILLELDSSCLAFIHSPTQSGFASAVDPLMEPIVTRSPHLLGW